MHRQRSESASSSPSSDSSPMSAMTSSGLAVLPALKSGTHRSRDRENRTGTCDPDGTCTAKSSFSGSSSTKMRKQQKPKRHRFRIQSTTVVRTIPRAGVLEPENRRPVERIELIKALTATLWMPETSQAPRAGKCACRTPLAFFHCPRGGRSQAPQCQRAPPRPRRPAPVFWRFRGADIGSAEG